MQEHLQGTARQPAPAGTECDLDESLTCDNLAGVRRKIARVLTGTARELVQDVELVATELASNACEHAEDPRQLRLRRDVTQHDQTLLIEVWDATPDRTPMVGTSSLGDHRGRGMTLVTKLCDDWGVRMDSERKVVWGRMRLAH
ncbi:ATP-binding protein [Actinophytocola glycyrrhizae]|uniref:ATP-binding protein n=1 Tax=Actinophytocola glycyrrhizae TaxID=2044873 RepID=A0ABV9RX48_9PSEU